MAKCSVEPESGGCLKVMYMPTEVGVFTILLQWNEREVSGDEPLLYGQPTNCNEFSVAGRKM